MSSRQIKLSERERYEIKRGMVNTAHRPICRAPTSKPRLFLAVGVKPRSLSAAAIASLGGGSLCSGWGGVISKSDHDRGSGRISGVTGALARLVASAEGKLRLGERANDSGPSTSRAPIDKPSVEASPRNGASHSQGPCFQDVQESDVLQHLRSETGSLPAR